MNVYFARIFLCAAFLLSPNLVDAIDFDDGGTHNVSTDQAGATFNISNDTTVNVNPGGGNIDEVYLSDTSAYNGSGYDNSDLYFEADGSSTIELSGGTYNYVESYLNYNNGTNAQMTISGGTFNDYPEIYGNASSTVNVTGGTFEDGFYYYGNYDNGTDAKLNISGGTFNDDVEIYSGSFLHLSGVDISDAELYPNYYSDTTGISTVTIDGINVSDDLYIEDTKTASVDISNVNVTDEIELYPGYNGGGSAWTISDFDAGEFYLYSGDDTGADVPVTVEISDGTAIAQDWRTPVWC